MEPDTVNRSDELTEGRPEAISVLVIDDDQDARELLAELLRKAGYSVETACNGHEGLNLLHWVRPSLILLDVHMPVMDGPHFREAQRQDPSWIEIPTIVMTADPKVNAMLDIAVKKTMRKPIKRADLLSAVAEYCEPQHAE
jgi:CheY-like chemotaxis protein